MTNASTETMAKVFSLCRNNEWMIILQMIQEDPEIATTPMIMDNHISTTILHQAITSKASTHDRAKVIRAVLGEAPKAATIKNGYGSLPLHVISQRNTKMDSQTKEHLIHALVKAFPKALMTEGGVGRRTPLHIAFTDYISPELAKMMIDKGAKAALMRDKKGWLPVHVAVSRHCSPAKLRLLLLANPDLHATTALGETLLDLAKKTATKSHPNFALIAELEKKLGMSPAMSEEEKAPEPIHINFPPKYQGMARRGTRKRKAEAANLLLHFSRAPLQEQEDAQRAYSHPFLKDHKPKYFRPVREDDHQPYRVSYGNEQKNYFLAKNEHEQYDTLYRKDQNQQRIYPTVKEDQREYGRGSSYRNEQNQQLFHPVQEEQKQGNDVFYSPPSARYAPQYAVPGFFEPKAVYYPPRQMFYSQSPATAYHHHHQDVVGEIVQL